VRAVYVTDKRQTLDSDGAVVTKLYLLTDSGQKLQLISDDKITTDRTNISPDATPGKPVSMRLADFDAGDVLVPSVDAEGEVSSFEPVWSFKDAAFYKSFAGTYQSGGATRFESAYVLRKYNDSVLVMIADDRSP
jgi:hypothetical protein